VQQFLNGNADGPVPFQLDAPDYRLDLLGDGRLAGVDGESRNAATNS